MSRPKIPAELKRSVLVEAGHRCAIDACKHIDVVIHHIIPWAKCKRHEYENLIALCPNHRARADKGEIDRKSLLCKGGDDFQLTLMCQI
jgi:predicted restriction endonuclease